MAKTVRTILLPAIDRCVPLGTYIAGVRLAIANPDREFKHGLTTWWPTLGAVIRAQFLAGVHDRINQCIPYVERDSRARWNHERKHSERFPNNLVDKRI